MENNYGNGGCGGSFIWIFKDDPNVEPVITDINTGKQLSWSEAMKRFNANLDIDWNQWSKTEEGS